LLMDAKLHFLWKKKYKAPYLYSVHACTSLSLVAGIYVTCVLLGFIFYICGHACCLWV
jgi:hypothetical protein